MSQLNPRITAEFELPAPPAPLRPLYFEPEEQKMCPACEAALRLGEYTVCSCVLFNPRIT